VGKESGRIARGDGNPLSVKIVFFTHGGILYGANLSMIDLIVGLREKGVESMVIHAHSGPIEDRLRDLGIPSKCIPFEMCVHWRSDKPTWHPRRWVSEIANSIRALRKERFNKRQLKELAVATRAFGADVAVSNASGTVIGLEVAKQLGIPHVWHIREFGDLDWDYYPDGGMRRRREQILQSAKVVCVSQAVADHFKKQCGITDGRVVALHDSIASRDELSARAQGAPVNTEKGPFTFAITGFVKYSKGQFDAVSALRRVVDAGGDARLVVAGQGATEELKAHVQALGVADRVEVLGHVSDLSEVYRRADCGLMCSVAEGFGRVTAEFMSWGKPVIGRNSGATPEIVEDGVNGLLYDGSVSNLAEKMTLMAEDRNLASRLGVRALEQAAQRFEHSVCATGFLQHTRGVTKAR